MIRCLFVGRFQPFHNGHRYAVEQLLKKYPEVIIMVGSANCEMDMRNPFDSGERVEMIRCAFSKEKLARLIIIPVSDVNNHSIWVPHVICNVPSFQAVYSNNSLVRSLFKKASFPVFPIKYMNRKTHHGKLIRKLIANQNKKWREYVPEKVACYLDSIRCTERLISLSR